MIEKIKREIKTRGLKKSHVAKFVGLSPAQLSQYLSGSRKMPIDIEFKIKKYLSI